MITLHSTSLKNNYPKNSFKGLVPVSYVVVDGQIVEDEKVVNDVTKQLVKQIKGTAPADEHLKTALTKASKDETLIETNFFVKKMGKFLVTGRDAVNLRTIWGLKDSKQNKLARASNYIKTLFSRGLKDKLAVHAKTITSKGKAGYIICSLFTTIY